MKSPAKKTLKRWYDMTDGNYHGEVREEIAKWFQNTKEWKENYRIKDYLLSFKYINKIHNENGCFPYECCIVRNILTNSMLSDIRKFNKVVEEKICSCL